MLEENKTKSKSFQLSQKLENDSLLIFVFSKSYEPELKQFHVLNLYKTCKNQKIDCQISAQKMLAVKIF